MLPALVQMRLSAISPKTVGQKYSTSNFGCTRHISVASVSSRQVVRATRVADLEDALKSEKKDKKKKDKEEEEDDDDFEGDDGLTPQQVETLLNVLCEETDIAQVELKMGGFKLKVRRSLKGGQGASAGVAALTTPTAASMPPAPLAPAPAAAPSMSDPESSMDEDDASVFAISAPKVGVLRRGRYVKGKQVGKGPVVEIGDTVKKGQVLCYIEQLGTHWPVECPQAGEVTAFLVEEGEAVEYKQTVVEISPFFGGHIIGDSKYA